jgi:Uma2 family endonuclease
MGAETVDTNRRYTLADIYAFPDDGRRYEIIDGVLHVTPLARRRHQRVVMRLSYHLEGWAEEHGGTVYPGVNVDLADDTHLEPDAVYSTSEDTTGLAFTHAPELVVEVSSPSTKSYDLGAKKARYVAEGVVEFWFVDLDQDTVTRFTRAGDETRHARGEQVRTPLLPGLVLDVDDLLGPPAGDGT